MINVCPASHKLGKIREVNQEVVIFCYTTPCLFPWPLYLRPKKFFIESTLGKLGLSAGIDLAVGREMPVAHARRKCVPLTRKRSSSPSPQGSRSLPAPSSTIFSVSPILRLKWMERGTQKVKAKGMHKLFLKKFPEGPPWWSSG